MLIAEDSMNDRAFDALVRRAATNLDRRALLGGLTGAALVVALPARRARAHELDCKKCDQKCEKSLDAAFDKGSAGVCTPFIFIDPELFEECENELTKCLQGSANKNCDLSEKSLVELRKCVLGWGEEFEAEGNPIKKFIKFLKKRADKKK
jgi:hypothetical protein